MQVDHRAAVSREAMGVANWEAGGKDGDFCQPLPAGCVPIIMPYSIDIFIEITVLMSYVGCMKTPTAKAESLEARVLRRIKRQRRAVFMREDFSDLGGYDQVGRVLRSLVGRQGNRT